MKQHIFFKVLLICLCWSLSVRESWAQEERSFQGKIVDNIYVVENRLLDESQLKIEEKDQYKQQLKSLRRNIMSRKELAPEIRPELPLEISMGGNTYEYVNGDYYEPKGKPLDYWVAKFGSNILEHRQNRNQINPGRPKKLEFFNKFGNVFKTIYHDKINPYIKYKNLKWGGIDYADTHHGFANQKPMEANNYLFSSTSKYSNGYFLIFFHVFSLNDNLVLKGETTLFIYDTKGNIYRKMTLPHIIEGPEVSENGQFLSLSFNSATDNPIDFNKNGYVQVFDLLANKVFYEEYGTKEYTLSGIFLDEDTGLYSIDINLKNKTYLKDEKHKFAYSDHILKFIDAQDKIIYSKYYTKEELKEKNELPRHRLSEFMQYDLFNQQKIDIK